MSSLELSSCGGRILENSDDRNEYGKYSLRGEVPVFDKKIYMGPVHSICFSESNNSILYAGIGPNLQVEEIICVRI